MEVPRGQSTTGARGVQSRAAERLSRCRKGGMQFRLATTVDEAYPRFHRVSTLSATLLKMFTPPPIFWLDLGMDV